MSKIVFIDVDGPMIPVRAYFLPNQTKIVSVFDPCATAMLLRLLDDTGAKLVISSTWGGKGKERCEELLSNNGINPSHLHDDWVTPRKMSSTRFHEISWWLMKHPEVTHYVAIDDEDLPVDWVSNAVLCDAAEGFSLRNFKECKLMLGVDEQYDLDYLKRREIWRLARSGDPLKHKLSVLADELFPRD